MSISLPPRPPELGDSATVDQKALIEEARRRARRRRQRNLAGLLAAMLGTLWLYSLVGGGGPQSGSAFLSESSSQGATPLNKALPEELSYNANGGITLIRRDGTRRVLARQTDRHLPDGRWLIRLYDGIEWSRDGSKLLALRWGSLRTLVVIDAKGVVGPKIAQALDGRWSPDETRIAFVRHVPGLGRVLFLAASDGRGPDPHRHTRLGVLVVAGRESHRVQQSRCTGDRHRRRQRSCGATPGHDRGDGGRTLRLARSGPCNGLPTRRSSPSRRAAEFPSFAPDGTSLRHVMAGGYQIAWSPDSRLLAVALGIDVYVVRADGGGLRRIAHCPCTFRGATGTSLAWSPDGSRIAYISGRGNDVSTIRPDGSSATVVAPRAVAGPSGLAVGWPLWRPAS